MLATFDEAPALLRIVLAMALAVALNAAYCLAYAAASGGGETLGEALVWGLVNIAPWVAAIELGRRCRSPQRIARLLVGALLVVIVGQALAGEAGAGTFWVIRALPGLLIALAAIVALRALGARNARRAAAPLDPSWARESQWIAAAGNYVELHRDDRVVLVRSTLAGAAEALGDGFVRVHRSYLVRRDAIRRVDRNSLLLECGKRLPVGAAFRAGIEAT